MSPVALFVVLAAVYLVSPGEKRCVTSLKTAARESEVYSWTNERSNRCYFHFFISFNFFCYQFAISKFNKGKNNHIELTQMCQLMRTYEEINIYLSLSSLLKFHIPKISSVSYSATNQFWGELNNWDNFPCSNFYHDQTEGCVMQQRDRRR